MNFDHTPKVSDMQTRLLAFMTEHIYPNEGRFFAEIAAHRAKGNAWAPTTLIEELKPKATAAGLWNLFLPNSPSMAGKVIDWANQAHGGGVSDEFPLAYSHANQRTLRLADGPDEVHRVAVAKRALAKHMLETKEVDMPVTRGC